MITAAEKKLIDLDESDPLPTGGINYQLYSFSGFGFDSTGSWTDNDNSLKTTLWRAFGVEFYPGSLNVRLVHGMPWILPVESNAQRIRLGVFHIAFALPVVLNEKCIGIVTAINVRGFDPATGEQILPPVQLGDMVEMYQIYSPVNIRERLGLEDKEKTDDVPITARLLSGDLLTVPNYEEDMRRFGFEF